MRASDTATLVMEECRVPKENLLGRPGEGFIQAMKVLDGGRISIAALALGMAQGAYECALAYAKQREQFGKPIAEFQVDPEQARRHGDGDRRGAASDVARGVDEGPRA